MKKLLAILGILACTSCNKNNFPLYVQLGGLRVLTLKALSNQSEVNPGTSGIVLQPVISDLNGGGRTLSVSVQTCADTNLSGAPNGCANPDSTSTSSFSSTTLSSDGTYTGLAPTITVNVPAAPANYAAATSSEQYNGVPYLVFYTISAPDGSSVTALKRIIVSSPGKTPKNQNPAISGVTGNGTSLAASNTFGTSVYTLNISFSVGPETYQTMNPDGSTTTQTESLSTTWFYTDGSTEFDRTYDTDANQWTPPSSHPGGRAAVLVTVTRDNRDGEDYQIFSFN